MPFPWPAHDIARGEGFDALLGFIHGFRMQVFFFLAGFFGHMVWRRLGTRAFVGQRALRIGLPFIVGMIVLVPILGGLWAWGESRSGGTYFAENRPNLSLLTYPTVHLWFLEMLLFLYVAALLTARLGEWQPVARALPRIDSAFDWLMRQWWKPFILVVPAVACLWNGPRIGELEFAGMALLPAFRAFAYYALFFALGWWLHRRIHLVDMLRSWVPLYLGIGFVAYIAWGISLKAAMAPEAAAHITKIKLVGHTAAALYSWCMTFAVTGLFLRFANGHRPWTRYIADASYWWYLWHLPIVIALQIWVAAWPLNGWLKLLLILALTSAILWPSYHYFVRYTWIGRILNGPRERKPN